jgi:hypothetical protein
VIVWWNAVSCRSTGSSSFTFRVDSVALVSTTECSLPNRCSRSIGPTSIGEHASFTRVLNREDSSGSFVSAQ